ncbi:FkbM family methyltransferase [Agrobacterium cavarae]|uniref:FkbM family methyltransferase n=1 Tax=Agrobacterium cavarae TaxID=2528239 RepID=UPI00196B1083|nr:FkbM family methyltransferase [Agrobacterium cavarae]
MKRYIRFLIYVVRNFVIANRRFVRLAPFERGKIPFYDKRTKRFLHVSVRDHIDSITADQVFTDSDYELRFLSRYDELVAFYERTLSQNKTPLIIDCGANIGCSALFFAREFPAAKLVAVEPERNNVEMIRKNCASLNNVIAVNKAVGSTDGLVTIADPHCDNNAFRMTREPDGKGDIPVTSIESLLSDYDQYVPFIIKIDIEGFEEDLFSANTGWLEKFPLMIIETHDWLLPRQANSSNFLKVISATGRDFMHRSANVFSISNTIEM